MKHSHTLGAVISQTDNAETGSKGSVRSPLKSCHSYPFKSCVAAALEANSAAAATAAAFSHQQRYG